MAESLVQGLSSSEAPTAARPSTSPHILPLCHIQPSYLGEAAKKGGQENNRSGLSLAPLSSTDLHQRPSRLPSPLG